MNLRTLIGIIAVFFAATEATGTTPSLGLTVTFDDGNTKTSTQASRGSSYQEGTLAPLKEVATSTTSPTLPFDKMELFKVSESSGSSVTVKAATTFKPLLLIKNGCHAYPAVNAAGQVSTGLQQADATGAACSGSSIGSQVYGRSAWYGRVWGIMYAWYFPDVKPEWEHVVVWINNPDVTDQTIRGVSMTNSTGSYFSQVPPDATKVEGGKNVKIRYKNNGLKPTTKK
ncbi:Necrosis inducing protein NPP1, partial [Phytophthora megakarya]